jgi:predicted nucleic acid-binding protein
VGLLDTLQTLYREIWIPDEVYAEYQAGLANPLYPTLDGRAWIVVRAIPHNPMVPTSLDAGEAAALSLALASHARLLLIDEHAGRTAARQLGLPISGSLGVLLEAKQQSLIPAILPYLEQMLAQGRYISPQVRQQALRLAGE